MIRSAQTKNPVAPEGRPPAPGGAGPCVQLRSVSKTFSSPGQAEIRALADIDLEIGDEEFVSLVGPSGCGKTTLLRLLAGLLPTSEGQVRVLGKEVREASPDVGIVFQRPVLLPWLKITDNVLLPIKLNRRIRHEDRDRAAALLKLAGLSGFEDKYPRQLSGGMQQRAAIVRALSYDPQVLLMDEPFGALDAFTREHLNLELLRIWRENQKTVVFVTHDIDEAVFLSDRVVVMTTSPGRIADIIHVDLDRPRSTKLRATPEFSEYTRRVRGYFFYEEA